MDQQKNNDYPPLEKSIDRAYEIFDYLLKTNNIDEALKKLEPHAANDLYLLALKALILTVNAFLTLEKEDIETALKSANEIAELSNSLRRRSFIGNVAKMIRTPNYNNYTDLELHAELTHAKFLAFAGALSFIESPNLINLIRVALKWRSCINSYKECRLIFKNRVKWDSDKSRDNFEAGIRLAHGCINLAISNLPPRMLRLVNFIGISGNRSIGIKELNRAAFDLTGVSSKLAQFVLLANYCYIETYGGIGINDLSVPKKMTEEALQQYPNSLAYKVFKAKLDQFEGRYYESMELYRKCLYTDLVKSHKIFHWELIWCHSLLCEWDKAIEYATLLRQHDLHSPAVIAYILAALKYTKAIEDNNMQLKDEATNLFRFVPTLRIRYVAKTITPEKIVVENSLKYFEKDEFLFLPVIEMIYQWNGFCIFSKNPELSVHIMKRIEKQIEFYKPNLDICDYVDNYACAVFYRGVIYRNLGKYHDALDCFKEVLNEEARIEKEYSLPPQATMEIGFTYMLMGDNSTAKRWLKKALRDYSAYLTENLIHLRIHTALRTIRSENNNEKVMDSRRNSSELEDNHDASNEQPINPLNYCHGQCMS